MAEGTWLNCCACKTPMWLPAPLQTSARASDRIMFYCAYGHQQHYPKDESEADKLRRERDRLAQQIAQRDDELVAERLAREAAERSASAYRGQVTRVKNRVGNGVCPCCNRTFSDLARHMHSKHPDYAIDNVVRLNPEAA